MDAIDYRIDQIERMVEKLEKQKEVRSLSVYKYFGDGFIYYFALSGFLNGKYFSFYITHHYSDSKEEMKNCGTTECKQEIRTLIKNLLNNED